MQHGRRLDRALRCLDYVHIAHPMDEPAEPMGGDGIEPPTSWV
jgi:hypothetical protein